MYNFQISTFQAVHQLKRRSHYNILIIRNYHPFIRNVFWSILRGVGFLVTYEDVGELRVLVGCSTTEQHETILKQ